MLEGKKGPVIQKAMEILYRLGEIYGAERMLPIASVHMPGSSVVVSGKAGARFVSEVADGGGKFRVFTTLNPAACDLHEEHPGIFEPDLVALQHELTRAYGAMGAVACHTCVPYLVGNVPRLGQHVAWGESSAVAFVNSVLGARTNREGGPSALAAALVGRVPAFGYHLDEGRRGTVVVRVGASLDCMEDFGTLGYFVGKVCGDSVPVFVGVEQADLDSLKMMGAALASSGAVALFHVVGVTPEAPTLDSVVRSRGTPELYFGSEEKAATAAQLNRASRSEVDLVVLGCPHVSVTEFRRIAELLAGKRVHSNVELWVLAPLQIQVMAERAGWVRAVKEAGGRVVADTCPVLGAIRPLTQRLPYRSLATNSAKLAHYAPGQWQLEVHYGPMERCIAAAIRGYWE